MPEFFNVLAPDVALRSLLDRLQKCVGTEFVPTPQALGRVTAEAVLASEHLPAFPRATMDGYAVRARDTFGASESLPAYLEVVGEVCMGQAPDITLTTGQAAVAYTGGMRSAHSADAVVMKETRSGSTPPRLRFCVLWRPEKMSSRWVRMCAAARSSSQPAVCSDRKISAVWWRSVLPQCRCAVVRVWPLYERAMRSSHLRPRPRLGRSVTSTHTLSQPWWNRLAACLSPWAWCRTTMRRSAGWL